MIGYDLQKPRLPLLVAHFKKFSANKSHHVNNVLMPFGNQSFCSTWPPFSFEIHMYGSLRIKILTNSDSTL